MTNNNDSRNSKKLSPARVAANRSNAAKSTGPRTPEGKSHSRQNATKHGLTAHLPLADLAADTLLLSPSDRILYEKLLTALIHHHQPATALELDLCHQIADSKLRLRRIRPTEDAMFKISPPAPQPLDEAEAFAASIAIESPEPPGPTPEDVAHQRGKVMLSSSRAFANLSIYEQRIQRSQKTSTEELEKLKSERIAREQAEMTSAINHYKERQMRNLPFDPAGDGFVLSTAQIERAIHLERRREQVAAAVISQFHLGDYRLDYPLNPKSSLNDLLKNGPKAA